MTTKTPGQTRSIFRRSARLVAAASAATVTAGVLGFASPASAGLMCGSTVNASTTLTQDLTNCPGDGLKVTASNITIDLGGHTIDGTKAWGSAGISLAQGVSGVHVRNGTIRDFANGIYLALGSSSNAIYSLTLSRNTTGVYGAQLADKNTLRSSRITENTGDGVYMAGSSSFLVGNEIDHNGATGARMGGSARLSSNKFMANAQDGLFALLPSLVERNTADGNGDDGIDVEAAGSTITGNSANFNVDHGIEAALGVTDGGSNTASGNGGSGCVNVSCP